MVKNSYIQIMRSILFFGIVLYHCNVPIASLMWGGVEIFFVLSGYFLFCSANKRSNGQFLKRRLKRLYEPYLPIIFVVIVVLIAFLKAKIITGLSFLLCVQNIPWLLNRNLDTYFFIGHTWTVAIEVQTACILTLLLINFNQKHICIFFMMTSIFYILSVPYFFDNILLLSLLPFSHLFGFGLGGTIYLYKDKTVKLRSAVCLIFAGLMGLILELLILCFCKNINIHVAYHLLNSASAPILLEHRFYGLIYVFISLVGGGMLLICLTLDENKKKVEGKGLFSCIMSMFNYIGGESYILYLIHYPVIYLVQKIMGIHYNIILFFISIAITFFIEFIYVKIYNRVKDSSVVLQR